MLQQVEHSSCIRCLDFETSDGMSFEEQDTALRAHLAEKHPDWQTDGGASILERRLPKSEKDRIVDLERQLADCAVILYERYAAQAQDNCSLRDRAEAAEAKVARLEDVIWQRGA